MNLFETKTIVSEHSIKELKLYLISSRQKVPVVLGIILSIYASIYFCSAFFIVLIFIFISIIPFSIKQNIKMMIKRIQETTNAREYECTTSFGDESLTVINHSTNGIANIYYDNIHRFVKTNNYYVLFTKAEQFVFINKKDIDQAQKKEEFFSFIESHCKNLKNTRKTRIIQIVLICLACIFAAMMYWENGRTIFESHAKPSEAELETVHEIIAFEQQKLAECKELLARYDDRAQELGIEIRPVLHQTRAVNHQGLVEEHDLQNELWLPKYYSSQIICYVYKDGEMLKKRTSNSSTSYFVTIFWLVNARKNDDIVEYNESPFDSSYTMFDLTVDHLLKQVSDFLQN